MNILLALVFQQYNDGYLTILKGIGYKFRNDNFPNVGEYFTKSLKKYGRSSSLARIYKTYYILSLKQSKVYDFFL